MTEHTKRKHFKIAHVIDEITLRQLERILSTIHADIEYVVYLKDGSRIIGHSANDVIALPNSKTNPIGNLEIEVWNESTRQHITVDLRSQLFGGSVGYSVEGSEQECIAWSQQIDEWVNEIKPWYSQIAVTNFVNFNIKLVAVAIVVLAFIGGIFILATGINTDSSSNDESSPGSVIVNLAFPTAFVLGILLNIIKHRLFPIATFATGYGKKRHEAKQRWRDFIGVTVIISFLVNVFAAWVMGGG